MFKLFDKDFFKFVTGFLFILGLSFLFIFIAEHYGIEAKAAAVYQSISQ